MKRRKLVAILLAIGFFGLLAQAFEWLDGRFGVDWYPPGNSERQIVCVAG